MPTRARFLYLDPSSQIPESRGLPYTEARASSLCSVVYKAHDNLVVRFSLPRFHLVDYGQDITLRANPIANLGLMGFLAQELKKRSDLRSVDGFAVAIANNISYNPGDKAFGVLSDRNKIEKLPLVCNQGRPWFLTWCILADKILAKIETAVWTYIWSNESGTCKGAIGCQTRFAQQQKLKGLDTMMVFF